MEIENLRYIVFMLDTESQSFLSDGRSIDKHIGVIECNLKDARDYAMDALKNKLCTRFVIGKFVLDPQAENMCISAVETYGFKKDKSNPEQLELFKDVKY